MSNIPELQNVPDVSFIDGITLSTVQELLIQSFQEKYTELTGEERVLPLADPVRLCLYAQALLTYQGFQYIDRAGKMDLLKYSVDEYLDNLAALKGLKRREAVGAVTTLRFTCSAVRTAVTGIPGGIRVKDDNGVCFATDEYAEIPAGQSYIDVRATALIPGRDSNGLAVDTINKTVDPVPYIATVTNTVESSGGDDRESNDDFTYRILMHPTSYSVAGPTEAYEYWARTFRTDIADVLVYTPAPTKVVVLFMLDNGVSPDMTIVNALTEFLRDKAIRPLTDHVTVAAPVDVAYNISLKYFINKSDSYRADSIQTAVNKAIEEYKTWQRKIGRDINPTELMSRIRSAGAKRVELTEPLYTPVSREQIARFYGNDGDVLYGGLEDD